jgi:hypothetical protein
MNRKSTLARLLLELCVTETVKTTHNIFTILFVHKLLYSHNDGQWTLIEHVSCFNFLTNTPIKFYSLLYERNGQNEKKLRWFNDTNKNKNKNKFL